MKRIMLTVAYDGTNYCGWQIQPNAPSVQQTLQQSLGTLLRRPVETVGAGRTDTGVHASFYVVHFDTEAPIADPEDAAYIIRNVPEIDGFFGASSIERLASERGMTAQAAAFKAISK